METVAYQIIIGVALIAVVIQLNRELKKLEGQITASKELVKAINRLAAATFAADAFEPADDMWDALKLIHNVGNRIETQTPALRRVLKISIGIMLDYLIEKTGITRDDLKGLEAQVAPQALWPAREPKALWPAREMILQEWTTHTEIWDGSGRRSLLVADEKGNFLTGNLLPIVLWRHLLPKQDGEYSISIPSLELALHENSIKFWAVGGRFDQPFQTSDLGASPENTLVTIPLNREQLEGYRWRQTPTDDPSMRVSEKPWRRGYTWGELTGTERRTWSLEITDLTEYVSTH